MVGYSSEAIEGVETQSGASLRTYTTNYPGSGKRGWVFLVDFPNNIFLPDAMVGNGWRWGDNSYFEFAGGLTYRGGFLLPTVILATGVNITDTWYVSLPIIYKITSTLDFMPLIGYKW